MSQDKYLSARVEYDGQGQMLVITVEAKSSLIITELQGYASTLQQFGASMPSNFEAKKFGEGVQISPETELEMQMLNESQFRWGTEISIKAGQTHTIRIPATKSSNEASVFTIGYWFPKAFGLLKGNGSIYVRFGETGDA